MGNVARPLDEQESKKAATQLLATLLLDRSPIGQKEACAAQDLQELYQVPTRDEGSALGAYWLKMVGGIKVLGDETMSRVAHEAVMCGQLTARDYPKLFVTDGGIRLLQAIGNVLIEQHASGGSQDPKSVQRNMEAWESARAAAVKRRGVERKDLHKQLKSATVDLGRALRSVEELLKLMQESQHCEIFGHCIDDASEVGRDVPLPCAALWFRDAVESLRCHISEGSEVLAKGIVQEKDFCGYANLPSLPPRGKGVDASREILRRQALDSLGTLEAAEAADDGPKEDDHRGEIVIENLGACTEPLPPGSKVRLVWVRRPYQSERAKSTSPKAQPKRKR